MPRTSLLPLFLLLLSSCRASCGDCDEGESASCTTPSEGDPAQSSPANRIERLARGTHSGLREARRATVKSSEEWSALWREHAGDRLPSQPTPEVDFDTHMVLAVILGERPTAGFDVDIVDAIEGEGRLNVRVQERAPAADSIQAQVITVPFVFAVVPRFDGEVQFIDV